MSWRPAPPPGAGDPRPVRASLERFAAAHGLARPALLSAVFGRWEELVGPEIARHATPRHLVDGRLTVVVDHPAWASSLRMLEVDLLARIADGAGGAAGGAEVRELRVVVDQPDRRRTGPRRGRNAGL